MARDYAPHLDEPVKGGWLTIDSAPKDGTEVDLWVIDTRGKGFRLPDCHFHCGEWLSWGDDAEIGWLSTQETPTHWMPLPEPPK